MQNIEKYFLRAKELYEELHQCPELGFDLSETVAIVKKESFCNKLLDEAKVVCTPGSAFGECGEGFMRVAYTAEKDRILQAIERISKFCKNL